MLAIIMLGYVTHMIASYTHNCRFQLFIPLLNIFIDCPAFGAVSNGVVTVLLNVTIHLSVQVKCNTGYIIKGKSINNCANGKWSYSKATCKGMYVRTYA